MATIGLGKTHNANKLISYAEKRAEVSSGVNCEPEYAKTQFKVTRELWGKNDKIQAHHIIQSFKPGEVTSHQANEAGRELAERIGNGHEVVIYTHTDKDHIHNHIVINSVNLEDGYKYRAHGQKTIDHVREQSDEICKEKGLSVVQNKKAEIRYTLAERGLIDKGEFSWKDDIRDKVEHTKKESESMDEFQYKLKMEHGVEARIRGKNITYIHPDNQNWKVRGTKLGSLYEKESLENEFEKSQKRRESNSRITVTSEIDRGLSFNVSGREHLEKGGDHDRAKSDPSVKREDAKGTDNNNRQHDEESTSRNRAIQHLYEQQLRNSSKNGSDHGKGTAEQQESERRRAEKDKGHDRKIIERDELER